MSKTKIEWKAPRRKDSPPSVKFYVFLLAFLVLTLILSIWQKNILFGVFMIIATGTILMILGQKPEIDSIYVDKDIISINNEIEYNLSDFSHFDIYKYNDNDYVLLLVKKSKLSPVIQIKISNKEDADKIMEHLHSILPRKKVEPSIIDVLQKIIGL